ncbi:MAG: hypothetical protein ABMB14_24630 [Myxococcota bacterium]
MRHAAIVFVGVVGCGAPVDGTPVPARADVVGQSGRVLSPGCVGSGYATVQSAIAAAATGDVVEVCPGTYRERLTVTGKTITVRSRDGAATTIVDAQSLGRTLSVTGGASVTVEDLTLQNGSTSGPGGNLYCSASTLTVRGVVATNGRANDGGGLGVLATCTGSVEDSTFQDNSSTWRGGGISVHGDAFAVRDNTLVSNDATTSGGGLFMDGDGDVTGNRLDGNSSAKWGGGAYVNYSWGEIADNTVIGNTSADDGAGIYVYFGAPIVERNTFDANDTDDEGGGLRIKLSEATILDNVFTGNHADYRGGGLKVSHDEVVMAGNLFVDNDAYVTGGGALLYESASDLSDETYEDNHADNGGALAILEGWGDLLLQDSTFTGNSARVQGGHLYVDLPNHKTVARRVTFYGGSAQTGGAVYAFETGLTFENVVLDHNDATTSGGAMYLDGVTGKLTNAVVYWNDAPVGGGMTIVNGPAGFTITNTVFRENWTGATLKVESGTAPVVRYSDFYKNSIDFAGMSSVIGANGNLAVSPSFVDGPAGDFHLTSTSAVRNVGDPAIWDVDGTRSDQGRYGGPNGY